MASRSPSSQGTGGNSVEGLKNALRDAIREDADQAVEDGLLTKEQADRFAEKLSAAVDELVETGRPGLKYGRVPAPRGPGDSSFGPTIIRPQPI